MIFDPRWVVREFAFSVGAILLTTATLFSAGLATGWLLWG